MVDEQGTTTTAFGFKAVPNGVLVDSNGTVRYGKYGGFSVERPDDLAAVERFAAGGEPGPSPADKSLYRLGATERELVEAKLRLGHLLEALGRRDEAVAEWRDALRVDPENLTIRKQIWAALHPEKFHPTIDWAWQKTQIAEERAAEVAAGICGPDGCPIRAGSGR